MVWYLPAIPLSGLYLTRDPPPGFLKQKIMVNTKFQTKPKNGARLRATETIPDQSMTIPQILDRFTRNLSVQGANKKPVYTAQTEFDLEALGRMDFHEKSEFAAQMMQRATEIKQALQEQAEAQRKASDDRLAKQIDARAELLGTPKRSTPKPPKTPVKGE